MIIENILNNIAAIVVILPLTSSIICALIPAKYNFSWLFSIIIVSITFLIAITLSTISYNYGEIIYNIGGWPRPIGIEYKINIFNSTVLVLTLFICFTTLLFSKKITEIEVAKNKEPLFYSLFLLCLSGMIGIIISNDVFNIFVFLEITALSSYGLIAMGSFKKSPLASFEYLIIGTIGATFYLIGIGFLYMMTGTLNINDLAIRMSDITELNAIKSGCIFIVIGLLLKVGIFPVHFWLPNTYQNSPSLISSFFSGVSSKISIYILIKFIYTVFDFNTIFIQTNIQYVIFLLASLSIIFGSVAAIFQQNLRRLLAFSSISQIGYIIIAIAINTKASLTAAMIMFINHAITKSTLFMSTNYLYFRTNSFDLKSIRGIAVKMPWFAASISLSVLSLAGIPLTAGFISKWNLIKLLISTQNYLLLSVIIIGSLFGFLYSFKIIETVYFPSSNNNEIIAIKRKLPLTMFLVIFIMSLLNLYLGIDTRFNYSIANEIGNIIFNGGSVIK